MSGIVGLINLIRWEVGSVNVRGKLWLERCTDAAKGVKLNTTEEAVILDFIGRDSTKTVFGVADKT